MPQDKSCTSFINTWTWTRDNDILFVLILFFMLFAGIFIGIFLYIIVNKKKNSRISKEIKDYKNNQILETQKQRNEMLIETKREISFLKKELEFDLLEQKRVIIDLENKIIFREELLNNKTEYLNKKEKEIKFQEKKINDIKENLENLEKNIQDVMLKQKIKLESIASLTEKEAYKIIIEKTKISVNKDIKIYFKNKYEQFQHNFQQKAKMLLCSAMQKYAYDVTNDYNVNIINITDDKIKGHIIGKDGRNIKVLESLTGVDFIINEVPNIILLSCFNPIRREIAKRTLEILISDGRINPNRIEKIIDNVTSELNNFIIEQGESAIFTTNIGEIEPKLLFLLGQLYFRNSYGQNVLQHSIEVAFLAGKLASEIGENELLARRAGLLHDIGKALDHENEGSHVEIGIDLANKYNEIPEVIDAIASHHEDKKPDTIIAILVMIADTLSAARPGSRKESLEKYVKRLTQLENIANNVEGVKKSYAIQAGREIRVIVKSEKVDDFDTFMIAKLIKEKIRENIIYKGMIKITVIREIRVIEKFKL
ncbi:MAG: ribonuclease Y [Candidatus Phytoplasma pyri]